MSISHVPELSTGWFISAPDPKIANCVSCPVATTGIPSGIDVSDEAFLFILPVIVPASTTVPNLSAGNLILVQNIF